MTKPIIKIRNAKMEYMEMISSYMMNDVVNEKMAADETNGVTILYLPFLSAFVKKYKP
tara:strand:- start:281 stop:454 length:174 start_codon:yes stop_codon:yes gene_type:complete